MIAAALVLVGAVGCAAEAAAQTDDRPAFRRHRYDEDWSALCNPARRTDPVDAIKCIPLAEHGLEWVHPEIGVAHPLDDGTAGVVHRSLDDTVAALGPGWRRVFGPLVDHWPDLAADVLRPPLRLPRHPLSYLRFGVRASLPATALGRLLGGPTARATWSASSSTSTTRRPAPGRSGMPMAS